MKNKIYIIGSVPNNIDWACETKFYRTQMHLLQMGYNVINPVERLTNKDILPEDAKKKNLQDLMFANAVYIMPCTNLGKDVKNLEIKLALDFNLTIVLGTIDLMVEMPIKSSKGRNKKIKVSTN